MTDHVNELGQPVGAPMPDFRPCPAPDGRPLEGRLCRLEVLDANTHAVALYEAHSAELDGSNWTYLPYGPFASAGDYFEFVESMHHEQDPMFYCIIEKATGRPLGVASYMKQEPDHGVVEMGHVSYSPALQRSAIATEAQFLWMRHVFDGLGYRRYEWKCHSLNGPSRAAAERLGFVYEGLLRKAWVLKGRNRDTAWYSILDSEWPALRTAFEAWLDPANFDADGQQRTPLGAFMDEARAPRS